MALILALRYDSKTRVPSPPGPGDMPLAVIDVTISLAGGNAYPAGGEPLDFGPAGAAPTGIALFRELHAIIPTALFGPVAGPGVDPDGALVAGFDRDTVTTGRLRLYRSRGALGNLIEIVGATAYTALFPGGNTPAFQLMLFGRPLTNGS